MKKKLFSVILLFCIIMSNLSFGLTGLVSFIIEKNNYNVSNIVDVQEQCNMLINIPKNFVNICVKIKEDFQLLRINNNNILFFNNDVNKFDNISFAILSNTVKLKVYFIYTKYFSKDIFNNYLFIFFTLLFSIFIFYLLKYLGLLRVFNSNYVKKHNKYKRLNYYSV